MKTIEKLLKRNRLEDHIDETKSVDRLLTVRDYIEQHRNISFSDKTTYSHRIYRRIYDLIK